jgi:hypothetical protein
LFNEKPKEFDGNDAFKKLTTWMRSKNLGAEGSFHTICA